MEIRFLKEEDRQGVCQLSYQINNEHHKNEPRYFCAPTIVGEDWEFWRRAQNSDGGFVLVCLVGHEVVGFVAAKICPMPDVPFFVTMTRCIITTIVVSNSHRRKGVGTALYEKVCEIARSRGAVDIGLEVIAFNNGAQKFYKKLGFNNFSVRMSRSLV